MYAALVDLRASLSISKEVIERVFMKLCAIFRGVVCMRNRRRVLRRKNLGYALCFAFVMFSVSAFAQTGFYRLPTGKLAIGMGYQRYQPPKRTTAAFRFNAQTLLGNLDYAFSRDLKVSLLPGVSFFETTTRNPYEIAPSPSVDIRMLNVNNLNMTGLKFFIMGGFRTQYMNIVRTGDLPLHSVNMALRGGAGFLHILQTKPGLGLKPFFGMFYTQSWNNVSTTRQVHVNTSQNFFTGEAGVEIDMSPTMSAIGSIEFSFDSSELLYRFGLNFYQAPTGDTPPQFLSQISSIDTSAPEIVSRSGDINYDPHIEIAGPQYKFKVDPKYPQVARNAGREGEVVLEATINEKGIPVDIIALTVLGFELEEAAIEALKRTTFYPAIWRGESIQTRVAITYTFRINM